jgi:acetyl/propionyl-CoA carboxylase alpha subunit
VPPFYDSLLAKLIAHGRDRTEAVEILLEALGSANIDGVCTNRELLRRVLASSDFATGAVTTGWLEHVLSDRQEALA